MDGSKKSLFHETTKRSGIPEIWIECVIKDKSVPKILGIRRESITAYREAKPFEIQYREHRHRPGIPRTKRMNLP